jgi:hypothetical protein
MDVSERKALEEESLKMRQLRLIVDLTTGVLYQDQSLSLKEARQMVTDLRKAVLRMFPGKEATFEIVLVPRFERILRERWGEGIEPRPH